MTTLTIRPSRSPILILASGTLLLLLALAGLWRWQAAAMPVILEIDGQAVALTTHATSPEALLRELGYVLHPNDALSLSSPWGPGVRLHVQRARPLRVLADGRERKAWTRARTLADALADAQVALAPADVILLQEQPRAADAVLPPAIWTPPAGWRTAHPWQQTTTPLTLQVQRATPITIQEQGLSHTVWTQATTIAAALAENNIPLHKGDELIPGPEAVIKPGMKVLLRRAMPVTLVADGKTWHLRTHQATVGDLLRAQGLLLLGEDSVQPPLTATLHPNTTIRITRIAQQVLYQDELTPFETVWEPDDDLLIDTRRVGDEGQPGVLRRRYRVHYENGQEVARELEDEWLAQEPRRKVILYGRKVVQRTAMTPDGPITYWRKLRAYTTSYSPKRSGTDPSLPWYGHTRLGFTAGKGVVGVDPAVVNMSQKLYVPGYGFAIAGDTGSGLHGRHLDLGYSDDDYESWHWWSDVYLLWPPPPSYAINYVLPDWPRYKGSRNPFSGLVQEQ